MKKLLFTLFTTVILFSCNQVSKQGAWLDTDMELCKTEAKADFTNANELLAFTDKSLDELIDCMCSSMEESFENYALTEDVNADEAGLMLMDCMGEKFQQLMNEEYRLDN